MAKNHMVVFNDFYQPAIIERFAQITQLFNAASGGAIVLSGAGTIGDYLEQSLWKALSGTRRVNRNQVNDNVTPEDMTQIENVSVKIAGGFGPKRYEPSQLTWLTKPTEEAALMVSQYFAEALMADQLNTALLAVGNAMAVNTDVTLDVGGVGEIDQKALNAGHALFGDSSQSIITQVMSGTMYHRLISQALTNANTLFSEGTVRIIDILGKRTVVTDAPVLLPGGIDGVAPSAECVLALTQGGVTVADGGDLITNIEISNGKERIESTLQSDYTFTLGMKGYTWDKTIGSSPSDAELGLGTNWPRTSTSHKHTAGVIILGDAATSISAANAPKTKK